MSVDRPEPDPTPARPVCCVAGCNNVVSQFGVCRSHRRDGHASPAAVHAKSVPGRLWAQVTKTDTCWLWTGHLSKPGGYGRLRDNRPGKSGSIVAHRAAYELLVGPVPDGLVLDHLCRVRTCVNPAHLEPVTDRENVARGVGISVVNAAKTHCPKDHEYTPENTVLANRGAARRCRTCVRETAQRDRDARKAGGCTCGRPPVSAERMHFCPMHGRAGSPARQEAS